MEIFSVYDSKAEAFLTPFFAPTSGVAVRMFESAANDRSHDMHKYGGDYTLFKIGTFDPTSGEVTADKVHANLGLALSYQKSSGPEAAPTLAGADTEPDDGLSRIYNQMENN